MTKDAAQHRSWTFYEAVIKEFENLTGIPVVLNTSFNENEPIVCKPEEAIECFLRTKMDTLVIGNYMVEKRRWKMEKGKERRTEVSLHENPHPSHALPS